MSDFKLKIIYILPFYERGTDTHLFYNYRLIEEAAKKLDIFLIIEKGGDKPDLGVKYYEQKFKFPPMRFLELLWKCFRLRALGYTNFYIHYSYYGALAALFSSNLRIFSRLTLPRSSGGSDAPQKSEGLSFTKIYYWNRGMPWLFKRHWPEEKIFQFILRRVILVTGPESLAKEYQKYYGVREYRVLSNWVDVERFKPENSSEYLADSLKAQVLQDLAQRDGASRAIRQQANMRVLAKLDAEAKKNARIVLFVHHLSKRKGADLIPEIAKGFEDSDVEFWIIGDGPESENLKGLAHTKFGDASEPPQRGLSARNLVRASPNMLLLGKIPNSELPKYFHAADVFLMPSREEGSPHVLLEAMASGAPFAASDVGGVRELIAPGQEQFLCKSEDVQCFQNKIKTLLTDKTLYENARNAGLKQAQNFDLTRGVTEFINLFQ